MTCPDSYQCYVACQAADGCTDLRIVCGTTGTSTLAYYADDACNDAVVTCGVNECSAFCTSPQTSPPVLDEGPACSAARRQ